MGDGITRGLDAQRARAPPPPFRNGLLGKQASHTYEMHLVKNVGLVFLIENKTHQWLLFEIRNETENIFLSLRLRKGRNIGLYNPLLHLA